MPRHLLPRLALLLLAITLIPALLLAAPAGAWRFRLGPFLEFGRDEAGVETWAIRPLLSSISHPPSGTEVNDLLWPAGTALMRGTHSSGRVLIAGWSDENPGALSHRHHEWLFPFYLGGETRAGEPYLALFPFYGSVPEIWFMQDASFVMFPFYLRYKTSHTTRRYTPWPFFHRAERDDGDLRYSLFPIRGSARNDDTTVSSYTFWPFWTKQASSRAGGSGSSQMLFPIYARTVTEAQNSWMAVPPFIFHGTVTNRAGTTTQTRAPWPLVLREDAPGLKRRSYWPLHGWRESENGAARERSCYTLWPFMSRERQQRPGVDFSSDHFFPFYYTVERSLTMRGGRQTHERYTRVWPLWSYQERDGQFRLRLLELWPMKDGGGIERNWAPFWTWFVRTGYGATARDTDVFWGLLRWGKTAGGVSYGQVTALVKWRKPAPDAPRQWRIFGMRVSGGAEPCPETPAAPVAAPPAAAADDFVIEPLLAGAFSGKDSP